MEKPTLKIYYIIAICYVIASLFIGRLLGNFLILFLGWNMILATLVLLLTHMMGFLKTKRRNHILEYMILGIWVLFFPNTLYIVSDLIHFQNNTFFQTYPNIYNYDLSNWIIFLHILLGALFAAKLGIISLNYMINLWSNQINHKIKIILINLLFLLSSLGIYIGRFIRFNSWQFYKIFSIMSELLNNIVFMIVFVGIFYIIHWVFYVLYKEPTKQI
jgi:uncharacterized membrane protein